MVFSEYVSDNAEKLRDNFVGFKGKKKLVVIQDYTQQGLEYDITKRNFNWDNFTQRFSKLIQKNTKGDLGKLMLNEFSTTGPVEMAGSEIILMNQCKKYFEYIMYMTSCGITKVHFLGDLTDWQRLA